MDTAINGSSEGVNILPGLFKLVGIEQSGVFSHTIERTKQSSLITLQVSIPAFKIGWPGANTSFMGH